VSRVRSQLALQLPPELITRVRHAAAAEGRTITALVAGWIEAGLSGGLTPAAGVPAVDLSDLPDRVAALEAALARLQRPALKPEPPPPPSGSDQQETAAADSLPPAAITTAALADRTATNRAGWNNWASPDRVGRVRSHPQAGSWRLVGKAAAAAGGPPRWLWEQV
jgi:hypothetical protein